MLSLAVIHCHAFWHRCIEPTVRLEHVTCSVFRVARLFDCFWPDTKHLYPVSILSTQAAAPTESRRCAPTFRSQASREWVIKPTTGIRPRSGLFSIRRFTPRTVSMKNTSTALAPRRRYARDLSEPDTFSEGVSWFGNSHYIKHYLAFSCATLKHNCQFAGKVTCSSFIGDQILPISYNTASLSDIKICVVLCCVTYLICLHAFVECIHEMLTDIWCNSFLTRRSDGEFILYKKDLDVINWTLE